jgi:hypothetical protein
MIELRITKDRYGNIIVRDSCLGCNYIIWYAFGSYVHNSPLESILHNERNIKISMTRSFNVPFLLTHPCELLRRLGKMYVE